MEDIESEDRPAADRHGAVLSASVYVVDEHDRVRSTLVDYIDAADGFHVVGASGSAIEALTEILQLHPRIAVVDDRLGLGSGLDLCRSLRARAADVSCVILTSAVGLPWGAWEAEQAGAAAFIVMRLRDFELIDVMGRIASGERPIDGTLQASTEPRPGQVDGAKR